jgi:dihydrodipicolinate reductase
MIGPYSILAGVAVWAGTLFAAYKIGQDVEYAAQAREDAAVAIASNAAASAAAHAISKLEVQRVEITSKAQTVVREVPVYVDCKHPAGMLDNINAARGVAPGGGKLPEAGPDH